MKRPLPLENMSDRLDAGDLILDGNGIWVTSEKTVVSYPASGNNDSLNWEGESFWFSHRNNVILRTIRMLPFSGTFVDIGGGNGCQLHYLAEHIENRRFVLAEPGYEGCLNARRRGLTEVFNVECSQFPFTRLKPGGIGLFDVLEHIGDDVAFLKDIVSRCFPGTRIYVTVPAYNWLWSGSDDYALHFRRYSKSTLCKLAASCGLRVLCNAYFFGYLVPLILLLRALPYRIKPGVDAAVVLRREAKTHKPGKIASYCLERLGQWELRHGPSGGPALGASCIAVLEIL